MTEESLPMEYSMTGFWNSAATSRKMWMLSASRRLEMAQARRGECRLYGLF